jgi:hypothetical protein
LGRQEDAGEQRTGGRDDAGHDARAVSAVHESGLKTTHRW